MTKDFYIIGTGAVYTSICTSLNVEEATQRLNEIDPQLEPIRWKPSLDTHFVSGETNPCQCPDTETHKHYLFNC